MDKEGKKKKKKLYRRKIILGKSQKIGFGALQVIWRSPEEEKEEKGLVGRLVAWGKEIGRKSGLNKIVIGGLEVRIVTCV